MTGIFNVDKGSVIARQSRPKAVSEIEERDDLRTCSLATAGPGRASGGLACMRHPGKRARCFRFPAMATWGKAACSDHTPCGC